MRPRGKLDIGLSDLMYALRASIRPGDRDRKQRQVEATWSSTGDAMACLSVRSGLDMLLQALDLPEGSEILVSAVTIRDMTYIVEHHGLVPIPVDVDMQTLSVSHASLEQALSERTRAILVAHLFGSRMPTDALAGFARQHNLILIEDCAQSYIGPSFRGSPDSDVCLFSFGPIKTNTALGGAIVTVRDRELLQKMRAIQSTYSVQSRMYYFKRVIKYGFLKLLTVQMVFTIFARGCKAVGENHDEVISAAVRGFPGSGLIAKIRQQPCYALLALLQRRLAQFKVSRVERRMSVSSSAGKVLDAIERPGTKADLHTYWVFPVHTPEPVKVMHSLWAAGFDATQGASSLYVVDPPQDRPELAPLQAATVMKDILYLPIYPGISHKEVERIRRTVASTQGTGVLPSIGRSSTTTAGSTSGKS
jgi:perosamine synthetase